MKDIRLINQVIETFFATNKDVKIIPAKDLMPYFIKNGIFIRDSKNGKPIRDVLRELSANNKLHLIPSTIAEKKKVNTNWYFSISNTNKNTESQVLPINSLERKQSIKDEHYIVDLCDEMLNLKGKRQYTFDFLRGDSGTNKKGKKLPVDVYYQELNLVVEYLERQHFERVPFFDKPNKITASGVTRGEQRKIYDARRNEVLPKNGIKLIQIPYYNFGLNRSKQLIKNKKEDRKVIFDILKEYLR
jgi:hypothetical protein